MTMHFTDFEAPAGLDDALAGCPVRKRIDAVCTEPGCPNNHTEPAATRPLWQRLAPTRPRAGSIYQTQPKDRCVM